MSWWIFGSEIITAKPHLPKGNIHIILVLHDITILIMQALAYILVGVCTVTLVQMYSHFKLWDMHICTQSYFIPVCGVERVCGFGVDPLAISHELTQQRLATTDGQLMAVSAILRYCKILDWYPCTISILTIHGLYNYMLPSVSYYCELTTVTMQSQTNITLHYWN